MEISVDQLAKMIDNTLLKPEATESDLINFCKQSMHFAFATVCINPTYVAIAADLLKGSNIKVCTVVGFPLGAHTSEVKAFETKDAIGNGASEIDMVMNIGALKSGNYELVQEDIETVVNTAKGAITKVIIETGFLTDEEKVTACKLAKKAGASFVKTSTGLGPSGAIISDVKLMRKTVGDDMGVKASGGIRTFQKALNMINAGASRIGTSSGIHIIKDYKKQSSIKSQ